MTCGNCGVELTPGKVDYLCNHCRVELDPKDWEERERVSTAVGKWLRQRGQMYYGTEIMFPEDSPWAWVRVFDDPGLAHPEEIIQDNYRGSGAILNQYVERITLPLYVVWKVTGDVYELDHGEVPDDPIFRLDVDE